MVKTLTLQRSMYGPQPGETLATPLATQQGTTQAATPLEDQKLVQTCSGVLSMLPQQT